MDATILVNRTHRLPRKAIPQTLVEPEIIFDAPVGDRKRLLAVSAAKGVEALCLLLRQPSRRRRRKWTVDWLSSRTKKSPSAPLPSLLRAH